MKNKILILLARMNFLFPYFLGFKFIVYKRFYKSNYKKYDNTNDVLKAVNHSVQSIPFYKRSNLSPLKNIYNNLIN